MHCEKMQSGEKIRKGVECIVNQPVTHGAGAVQLIQYYNSCLYVTFKNIGKLGTRRRRRMEKRQEKYGMGSGNANNRKSGPSTF